MASARFAEDRSTPESHNPMTAISEALSDERKHSPELVAALLNLKTKLEALPEPLRGPFVVEGLKPYLRSGNGGEVRVKALEWQAIGPVGSDVDAETPIGTYTMSFDAPSAGGAINLWMAGADVDTFTVHETRASAVAHAQADYETRIRSALDIKP